MHDPFASMDSCSIGFVSSSLIPHKSELHSLGKEGQQWKNLYAKSINLDGTAITSTAAELNMLDGIGTTAVHTQLAAKQDTESLGAKFIEVPGWKDAESSSGHASLFTDKDLQNAFDNSLMDAVKDADVVITTARLFGANAPKLFFGKDNNERMTKEMKEGSVIVDMNTDTGGNIVGSKESEVVEKDGVTIVGIPNLCRTIPNTASMLYSNNVTNFVTVLVNDGKLSINQEEQVLTGDEGGISAGYGGILIAEDGKIHENHTKLVEAMK